MMSHLLVLSVGPIQDFIAAARRTRDLWYGSYLLSEISKAIAKSVAEQGGSLVFPALKIGAPELQPKSEFNVANIIVAELPEGIAPKTIAEKAGEAGKGRWEELAEKAKEEAGSAINEAVWEDQVDDVLEFYAAWVPLSGDYKAARKALMRLHSGRKACRDFLPAKGIAGLPKSSLDGARETVLADPNSVPEGLRRKLRLSDGEQLDAVGLTKRAGGGQHQFPSVPRIAADPWLRGTAALAKIDTKIKAKWETFLETCKTCCEDGLARLDEKRFPQYKHFPYEGAAAYRTRHEELIKESGCELLECLAKDLKELTKCLGDPDPYLAILVADGDKMGAAIGNLGTAEDNRKFSQKLADFARMARGIVVKHFGALVYAGGDDVMAFVPVDQCLVCARELHEAFGEELKGTVAGEQKPTLSVGIAIGHSMDPLEDLLGFARAAEGAAKKPNRDGLAVHLHPRSGAPLMLRGGWTDNFDKRLSTWVDLLLADRISDSTAYDLRELARVYAGWPDYSAIEDLVVKDALRLLGKKQPRAGKATEEDKEAAAEARKTLEDAVRQCVKVLETASEEEGKKGHPGVMRLAKELLIARRLSRAAQQAQGSAASEEEVQ